MFAVQADHKADIRRTPKSEDCEGLLSDSETSSEPWEASEKRRGPSWAVTAVLLLTFSSLSAFIGARTSQYWAINADEACILQTSQYSPVIEDVGVTYNLVQFNGSLLKPNAYRQDAGPEVDAIWMALGVDYRSAIVPSDIAARSGLQPDQVKISQKYGGGYPANVEGLHHLHCLNLLRKSLSWNFEYYRALGLGPFSNSPEILKLHVTHCLDVLRQQLMCSVDVGVLGQVWLQGKTESEPHAFVDFNTEHKCRNFDAIREWAEAHQLPETPPEDFLEPPKAGDRIYDAVP